MSALLSALLSAMNTPVNMTTTDNGCAAFVDTGDKCLDLFYLAGASRGKSIWKEFNDALSENLDLTLRIMLHLRDVRGGVGERQQFRNLLMQFLSTNPPEELVARVLLKVPELGRWDDLHCVLATNYKHVALALISEALQSGNALCAKWTPRQGPIAGQIRAYMGMSPKAFRKHVVGLTNVVEQLMCAGKWNEIEYGKLPSIASSRYMTAFHRHDSAGRYQKYKDNLVKGEVKINAGAIFPYDVIKGARYGNEWTVSEAQWKALPDYFNGSTENVIALVDVSSSMNCSAGGNGKVSCIDVSAALGMYCAERTRGIFKDHFLTFHTIPELVKLTGNFQNRVRNIYNAPWGESTNLIRAFELILNTAKRNKIDESEMPTTLIIFSDMQFNVADSAFNSTAFEKVDNMYEEAGYKRPKIVFWNLNASNTSKPVTKGVKDTMLVSGFSPSLIKTVLGPSSNPLDAMLETIMVDRYNY